MKRGSIACTPGAVLLAFEGQNRLDSYWPADGQLRWHVRFEGVTIPALIETERPDGRRAVREAIAEHARFHSLLGVAAGDTGPAVVQFGRHETEELMNGITDYVVETFIVDSDNGQGAHMGDELPEVLATRNDMIALLSGDPFPLLEIAGLGPPANGSAGGH